MKQKISAAVIIVASLILVLGTLITNRIQTASIQAADQIAPDEQAAKVSLSIRKIDLDQPLSDTLRSIYSSSGGMLVISGVNFIFT